LLNNKQNESKMMIKITIRKWWKIRKMIKRRNSLKLKPCKHFRNKVLNSSSQFTYKRIKLLLNVLNLKFLFLRISKLFKVINKLIWRIFKLFINKKIFINKRS
jgi:hypothetical protein